MFNLSDEQKARFCWLWIKDSKKRKEYRAQLKNLTHFSTRFINRGQLGSDVILNELKKGKPCLVSRFGTTELRVIQHFFQNKEAQNIVFPQDIKDEIRNCSGFFSNSDELLLKYSCDVLQILKNVDVFTAWCYRHGFKEKEIFECYNTHAKIIDLHSLLEGIFNYKNPWTQYLEGKKVLVLHPFEKTIYAQYKKRELLFKNPLVLPKFDLKVIKVVQGLGESSETGQFENWFDALQSMYRQIDEVDFDIALVSGGAYGMFLANYIKDLGKQAVHTAGATQLLFGIIGSRWVEQYGENFAKHIMNEHWVYPSEDETPKKLEKYLESEGFKAYW